MGAATGCAAPGWAALAEEAKTLARTTRLSISPVHVILKLLRGD